MAERKGKKLRRCTAASKARYKVQFGITDNNRAKKMRKHIRANPSDAQAKKRYEVNMGRADTFGLSSKGKKLEKRLKKQEAA